MNTDPKLLWSGGFDPRVVKNDKILLRQTGDSLVANLDDEGFYHLNNMHAISPKEPLDAYELKYLLALLNSKLMNYYYHLISLEFGRAMAQTDIETLELLPIKQSSKEQKDEIVELVDKLLALHKKPIDEEIQAKIDNIDKKIDDKVSQLYDIKLVE